MGKKYDNYVKDFRYNKRPDDAEKLILVACSPMTSSVVAETGGTPVAATPYRTAHMLRGERISVHVVHTAGWSGPQAPRMWLTC